jgi:hypothetical protein
MCVARYVFVIVPDNILGSVHTGPVFRGYIKPNVL